MTRSAPGSRKRSPRRPHERPRSWNSRSINSCSAFPPASITARPGSG
ncbi:MAG: hypothetical protein MZV64_52935 [Ignavibacteriales bacterium]|nr:hypothetical protein [Ignavibacteriales bacterium]